MRFSLDACLRSLVSIVGVCALALGASAQGNDPATGGEAEAEKRHSVGVFLGGAIKDEDGTKSGFALGVGYDYRWVDYLSTGVQVEVATGSIRDLLALGTVKLHPWRGLSFVVGPGVEVAKDGAVEFALRLGTAYEWELPWFNLGPEFNVDLVDGEPTFVFGIGTSFEF